MHSSFSAVICRALGIISFTLPLFALDAQSAGKVKVVQKTPPELASFGISFEKLDFTFGAPVTAQFWIDSETGKGKRYRMDVPHDYALPTSHYALSYLQLADDQVSVSVTTDGQAPENQRTAGTGGGENVSGSRIVTYQLSTPRVDYDRDIELFRATTKPSWRHPHDPTPVVRIMARFSAAEFRRSPVPMEDNAGWENVTKGRLAILHREKNSFDWKDVSPKVLEGVAKANPDASFWDDLVDLSAVDANEAWVAVVLKEGGTTQGRLEHTTDGGKIWHETASPAGDAGKLSFVDSHCGFLLALGSPSAGVMKKAVYGTTDGGVHWQLLAAPGADGESFYPTGICFRSPKEGWITATYHGAPAVPLFHTRDGSQSWQVQELEIPPDFQGGYADIYPPFFYPRQINADLRKGQLPVKLVRHTPAPGGFITGQRTEVKHGNFQSRKNRRPRINFAMSASLPPPLPQGPRDAGRWSRRAGNAFRIFALVAITSLVVLVVLRVFGLLRPFSVPTGAMSPTIDPGDHVLMEGMHYLVTKPKRGDVIVFKTDEIPLMSERAIYVKRLVGLPGERLSISNGALVISGQRASFRNAKGEIRYVTLSISRFLSNETETFTVPDGQYFVLGDNSAHSADSRLWGGVPTKSVLGRAVFCYWPAKQMRSIR